MTNSRKALNAMFDQNVREAARKAELDNWYMEQEELKRMMIMPKPVYVMTITVISEFQELVDGEWMDVEKEVTVNTLDYLERAIREDIVAEQPANEVPFYMQGLEELDF